MQTNLITSTEAAKILKVSQSRVRQFHLAGRLVGERRGRDLFFDRKMVEKFKRIERTKGRPKAAQDKD